MKNKIKILGITALLSATFIAGFVGCASYTHTQTVEKENGGGISEVYYRDTGTTNWVRGDISLQERGSSKTPPDTKNKDIRIVDNAGRIYTKLNVPSAYATARRRKPDVSDFFAGLYLPVVGWIMSPAIRGWDSYQETVINDPGAIIFTDKDRHPILSMQNKTGIPIRITAPAAQAVNNGATAIWSLPELDQNRNITVNYSVNDYTFTKNVELNADVTLLLTEKPPTVTIVNNTGYPVNVSSPFSSNIANGGTYVHPKQSRTASPLHTVTYRIGELQYDEQVTINDVDVTLSLTKKPPTLTVINNTGYLVNVSSPFRQNITNGEKYAYLRQSANPLHTVNYRISNAQYNADYKEEVTINNNDVTLTLTKGPPVVTIVNNTGYTVNLVFSRKPGTGWAEPNLLTLQIGPDGRLVSTQAGVQTGERRGSITNREILM